MSKRFLVKTFVIIGAGGDLANALSELILDKKYNLVLIGRNKKKKKKFLNKKNILNFTGPADNDKFIKDCFQTANKYFGSLDILCNVSGSTSTNKIEDISENEWHKVMNDNLKTVFVSSKNIIKFMKNKRKINHIINVSSIAGRTKSTISGVHYTASKAGVIGFTRQLAYEVSNYNIRVNCVAPSQINSKMLKKSIKFKNLNIKSLEKNNPLKRILTPKEVAKLIIEITNPTFNYMNGAVIDLNGGM